MKTYAKITVVVEMENLKYKINKVKPIETKIIVSLSQSRPASAPTPAAPKVFAIVFKVKIEPIETSTLVLIFLRFLHP